ncbi:MAG: hypothetical protein M1829_003972 [Trizodia sp. TS-e1964]|nr:MAG: hypothetical protein M1829_003972 [Trizodia sp. TS-e1964]
MATEEWLDSLSEDWIPQPRSSSLLRNESDKLDQTSLKKTLSPHSRRNSDTAVPDDAFSSSTSSCQYGSDAHLNVNILGEVSFNVPFNNTAMSPISPPKSKGQEPPRGRRLSRIVSTTSNQSVQRHPLPQKSFSSSPQKNRGEVPEWKRRLLGNGSSYGNKRDLFSPIGLEGIFRPPSAQPDTKHPLPMVNDTRKGSVTTQDFLDEATKIMGIIRARQGRRSSRLAESETAEEAENILYNPQDELPLEDESTKEEFSRPPSREGLAAWRQNQPQQLDPRIMSHLKKFEESAEKDDLAAAYIESQRSRDLVEATSEAEADESILPTISEPNEHIHNSSSANIRIIDNPNRKRKFSGSTENRTDCRAGKAEDGGASKLLQPSSGRSFHTGSSTRSESRRVIAPHSVSHLIPGQVAGMVYDNVKQVWVKQRNSSNQDQKLGERTLSNESEEDPFGSIPDLSVNEFDEVARLAAEAAKQKQESLDANSPGNGLHFDSANEVISEIQPISHLNHTVPKNMEAAARLQSSEDNERPMPMSSVLSTAQSRPTSKGSGTETRATSWGNDSIKVTKAKVKPYNLSVAAMDQPNEVEHEIKFNEGRAPLSPDRANNYQSRRNVTIAFSSPLVSMTHHHEIQETPSGLAEAWSDVSQLELGDSGIDPMLGFENTSFSQISLTRRSTISFPQKPIYRGAARRRAQGGQRWSDRPISRIDEHYEDSMEIFYERHNQRSRAPSATVPLAVTASADLENSHITFHLSPLPDFTVHQNDERHGPKASHLARRLEDISLNEIHNNFSLVVEKLVRKLTDVEPYEPHWEFIRQLDLVNKGLVSLHMLDEFCSRIEVLDVSENQLGHLSGVPSSVRNLRVMRNSLSSLTAWDHLSNLQYLDISGNEVTSLEGLRNLLHLRELTANDNQIESLDGLKGLDGLLVLRMRRNKLKSSDFRELELSRMAELDLQGNGITEFRDLHELPALRQLNLDENKLRYFDINATMPPHLELQSLKLARNQLELLDVTALPNLRSLCADQNLLTAVRGVGALKSLETVSLRSQHPFSSPSSNGGTTQAKLALTSNLPYIADMTATEARSLFLSANPVPSFCPLAALFKLQHLEIASSGLASLPDNFGVMLPDLRTLNLNFNAISDVEPLLGMDRLVSLLIAGNRVDRMRRSMAVLARLPKLKVFDLRNNPLTVGFYPPPIMATDNSGGTYLAMIRRDVDKVSTEEPGDSYFVLPRANAAADEAYAEHLDPNTKIRRRVYEMLVLSTCRELDSLDGIVVQRSRRESFAAMSKALVTTKQSKKEKDGIWDALLERGVLVNVCKEKAVGDAATKDIEQGAPPHEKEASPGKLQVDECRRRHAKSKASHRRKHRPAIPSIPTITIHRQTQEEKAGRREVDAVG